MSSSSAPQLLDIRTLAHTREILAYHDGGLFPVLALTPSGVIVAVLRGGAGHIGQRGRIEIIRSLDAGQTWSPPTVIADSDCDDRNPALGVSPAGTLVLAYHRLGGYDAAGNVHYVPRGTGAEPPIEVMVTRSFDEGVSWARPGPLAVELLRTGSPFGKIIVGPDGTLFLAIYLYDPARGPLDRAAMLQLGPDRYGSYLVRSHDDGRTWEEPTLIAPAMDETGLLALPNGDLLALLRGSDPEARLWSARSADGGHTWSPPMPVTAPHQLPADLAQLANGDILLAYGNRMPPYRIEGLISRDGGHSWLKQRLIFSGPLYGYTVEAPRRTDLGYPASVILRRDGNSQGVTMYYYNPSLPMTGDWQTEGPAGPLYANQGYRAVAVTWDEAELIAAIEHRLT